MGGEWDAAARKHDFLICPPAFVPHRISDDLAGDGERDSEVKVLDFNYLMFGVSGSRADVRKRISCGGATYSNYRECRASVDAFHYTDWNDYLWSI